jgi:hypothetical protein
MMARITKARMMIVLMAATVAGGLLTGDAQARGGGHGGGGFGGAIGGAHMGGFRGAAIGGIGRGIRGNHHRYGAHSLRYGNGYAYGDWDCSLYGWQYGRQWPNVCY